MHRMLTPVVALLSIGCVEPTPELPVTDSGDSESPVDTGASKTLDDTGSTKGTTPSTPGFATVTARVSPGASNGGRRALMVADVDGSHVRTVEVPADTGTMTLEDVPVGGFVTWAHSNDQQNTIETMAGVQDGDELWFSGADTVPDYQLGSFRLQVPAGPGVAYGGTSIGIGCQGWVGSGIPFDQSGTLSATCASATPGEPVDAYAVAFDWGSPSPANAIAFLTDLRWTGTAPTAVLDEAVLDNWISDFGRTEVAYTHRGASTYVGIGNEGRRGFARTQSSIDGTLKEGDILVAPATPTHQGFHTQRRVTLFEDDPIGQRYTYVEIRFDDAVAQGQTARIELDRDDLPPMPTAMQVDGQTLSARLPLPDAWSCDGQGPTMARLDVRGGTRDSRWTWWMTGPYAEAVAMPELDPELAAAVDAGPVDAAWGTVVSLDDPWDAVRTHPAAARAAWSWLDDGATGAGRSCTVEVSDTSL